MNEKKEDMSKISKLEIKKSPLLDRAVLFGEKVEVYI
jgi:hypothetical protein